MKKKILANLKKLVVKLKGKNVSKLNEIEPNLENYHLTIDTLPLQSWIDCQEGKIESTRKDAKRGNKINDEIAWEKIQDSYLHLYGMSKTMEKIYKSLKQKAIFELNYVLTNDRMMLTFAEMEEQKVLSMLSNKTTGITIQQSLVYLSQWMNQWLTIRSLTTREYFDLIEEMEKFNKKTSTAIKKNKNGK